MQVLGIDVGGSALKAAIVDTEKIIVGEKFKLPTDKPANKEILCEGIKAIVKHFDWNGTVGIGFPGQIDSTGKIISLGNLDKDLIGFNPKDFGKTIGLDITTINDADAAGVAEMEYGAGKNIKATTILITVGTGLGTALFIDGKLVPNTELGHLAFNGENGFIKNAEKYAAGSIRTKEDLSLEEWAKRFNEYLRAIKFFLYPEKIIMGGGISDRFEEFSNYFDKDINICPATACNEAGILGAAVYAEKK